MMQKAIALYGLLQVKLVWVLITAHCMNLHGPKKAEEKFRPILQTRKEQTDVLEHLSNALEEGDSLDEDLDILLNVTVDSNFNSPIIAFIALICLKEDGSYANIHLIPPPISKIQFLMRLFALCKFNCWREELGSDGDCQDLTK